MTQHAHHASQDASLLLYSGRVFTGTALHPTATAVLIAHGRIQKLGTDDELLAAAGPDTQRINVEGGLITPGFIDAHIHAAYGGVERKACDLTAAESRTEVIELIQRYVGLHPTAAAQGSEWIFGGGWYGGYFAGGLPTAPELDELTGGRPAYLISADHHSVWVNTAAMQRAGIDATTEDPPDGVLERDASGAPTGVLHEGAMDMMASVLPPHTLQDFVAGLRAATSYLHSTGVTGWQEAILGDYAGYSDASEAYRTARQASIVDETATGALWVPRDVTEATVPDLVADFVRRRDQNAEAGFTTRTAKIMVDGVPESKTAAMLEDYCRCNQITGRPTGQGQDRGLTYLSYSVLQAVSIALDAVGFDLHFHGIGDRAVRWSLDAIAAARQANPASDGRHHIAHIQVVHPDDVQRFHTTGATANIQALWACNDPQMVEQTIPQLGEQRASWQYPFASIAGAGGKLCMGSDWPVSTPDPWQAIHVAVNRSFPHVLDPVASKAGPLVAEEALELTTALTAYTAGSAWQLRLDDRYGHIVPGAVANLAVANRNPFADVDGGEPAMICTTENVLTVLAGRVVFDQR